MPQATARDPDPTLPVPTEADCGEAMLSCSPAERAFVTAMVESGGQNHTACALRAGIGGDARSASVSSTRMMQRPRVIAAIREMADRAMQGDALLGRAVLHEIALDTKHKDRFKAGVELLNRAGLLVETRHHVIVENDTRTTEEIRSEVETMLKRLYDGRPLPAQLLPPIEGEVVEVYNGIDDLLG